jgi:isopenicillin N synthase-like dioxygenase
MNSNSIPVIDICELKHEATLALLDEACRDWGFFQVVNHGIPAEVIAGSFSAAHAFFALPLGSKRRISRTRDNPWGFYDRELTRNVRDWKQIYDYGPADGAGIRPQWPQGLPHFRSAIRACYRHSERLAFRLLAAISINLGMSPGYLSQGFGRDHTSFLRLNYYPVCPAPAHPRALERPAGGHLGVGPHTDSGALTLLFQDDQPGLEVFRQNEWYRVEPRRDAIVVNIGDMVQVWSNDRYFAALHRVLANAGEPRFSIPFFLSPEYRTNYAPLETTISEDRPARYREINWGEFRRGRARGDFADYGEEIQIGQYRISA